MINIFARTQSSKVGLAGIYYHTKLTFSEITKEEAGKELMYRILNFTIHFRALQWKISK